MTETKKTCCYKTPTKLVGFERPCQFMGEPGMEDNLVQVGGLWFCPYHLPFSGENLEEDYGVIEDANHEDFKNNWSDEQRTAFNADIHHRLEQKLGVCDLIGIVFPGEISFAGKEMIGVEFTHALFPNGVSFLGARVFGTWTSFRGARFYHREANFQNAQFSGGTVDFVDAQFSGCRANFQGAAFAGGTVEFTGAKFSRSGAYFQAAQFSGGTVDFVGAKFSGNENVFADTNFEQAVNFSIATSNHDNTSTEMNICRADFSNATFGSDINFNNRSFVDRTSFKDATFERAPTFHGCVLHQDTVFPPIENFRDNKSDGAAHAYRTLRLAMKQQEAHEEEAMFWALEQRSKRNTSDTKIIRAISWAYDKISEYGLRTGRPAGYLGLWTFLSTIVYIALNSSATTYTELKVWADAVGFSIAQIVRPFFIWSDYDNANIKAAFGSGEFSFLIKMLATFDSAVSLTLIALFILAVRRRFRMQ